MNNAIIQIHQSAYMDAISLAEGQIEEARNKLNHLENMTDLPDKAKEVHNQRQALNNLLDNLWEMKTAYFTIFGVLPSLP